MSYINFGSAVVTDFFHDQKIYVYRQPADSKVTLLSAKTGGMVTDTSVQLLKDITHGGIEIDAKMNANYFVMSSGQALGVRCGLDEWSVPRQGAWYYYALKNDGSTEIGMDYDFWYAKGEIQFACSPAMILMYGGMVTNYKSAGAGSSKDKANTQSMLIKSNDAFYLAVCVGKLNPDECREWAVGRIPNVRDMILMDSGGSTCLEVGQTMVADTTRRISNCIAFYHPEKKDKDYLQGIDISNWQKGINLEKVDCDFVIVKATEGIGYVDPCADMFYQKAKALGKKLGFYHFARPSNDAVREAQFFYENTKNYFGEAIPVLDWEAENKNDVAWALRWLNEVYRLSGVKPLIYMSESVVNAYDWSPVVKGDYGLWVAKYRDNVPDVNYDMSLAGSRPSVKWWSFYAMWQWTSVGHLDGYDGSLDCDIFYGTADTWDAYAYAEHTAVGEDTEEITKLKAEIKALNDELEACLAVISDYKNRQEMALKALKGEL